MSFNLIDWFFMNFYILFLPPANKIENYFCPIYELYLDFNHSMFSHKLPIKLRDDAKNSSTILYATRFNREISNQLWQKKTDKDEMLFSMLLDWNSRKNWI